MSQVELRNLVKKFGNTTILHNVSLHIPDGHFTVLVGPSGCGKSTLLRLIAGLEKVTSGSIFIDDVNVNNIPSSRRNLAMVFQSYALYPHLSIFENIAFGMRISGQSKAHIQQRVNQVADMLKVTEQLHKLPKQLSGGQRQRVAIARALVRNPHLYLFDEPLSNLDASLRIHTRVELAKLHEKLQTTMIYVTHDQVEAMTLADTIVVMNDGRVEQYGSPMELYFKPANRFVASFIGSLDMNFLNAELTGKTSKSSTIQLKGLSATIQAPAMVKETGVQLTIGIRPENIFATSKAKALFSGYIDLVESLGDYKLVYVRAGDENLYCMKTPQIHDAFVIGERIHLAAKSTDIHIFDSNSNTICNGY